MRKRTFSMDRLERYGLRVICLSCAKEGRVKRKPGDPRLRHRRCPRCGVTGAVRSKAWVERFPERAAKARRELDWRLEVFR